MKKSKTIQSRKEKEIEEKSKLLKNIESIDDLKLNLKSNKTGHIIEPKNLSVIYGDNTKILEILKKIYYNM